MNKDLNYIANVEKAVAKKYGKEAICNPKSLWNEEKEERYLKDLEVFYKEKIKKKKTVDREGFLLKESNLSLRIKTTRICPVCEGYSFDFNDDLYMYKFDCCFECYIQYVENREDRWKNGWRPNK